MRKAEEAYLAAAASTATPQQPQTVGLNSKLHGRRANPSRMAVSATRGRGVSGKKRAMGGRGGRADTRDDGDGGDGDADTLACIGKTSIGCF